ncbi:HAMP domain-containing protein [Duganella sp. FT92W]|uniref:HAMP domain-containing protein n=1 Tax=Pseudoduganella rivuli TaxID=2666085 RepID=A0A7X2IT52_9BURK|nr:methyl-accepting chemotaxis protein [Pseudoduganella rivuli]MRV75500.1 HAMP domain-containing protein [Pseudoduganella rivuli]
MRLLDLKIRGRLAIGYGGIVFFLIVLSAGGMGSMLAARGKTFDALDLHEAKLAQLRAERDSLLQTGSATPAQLAALSSLIRAEAAARSDVLEKSESDTRSRQKVLYGVLALLALGIAAFSRMVTRSITTPLARLQRVAHGIAGGQLGRQVAAGGKDEIGDVMRAMRAMDGALTGMVSSVTGSAGSIASSARELAAANADLSGRTESQAGSLAQTAATLAELTEAVGRNARHAQSAHAMVRKAAGAVQQGSADVLRAVEAMQAIRDGSRAVADVTSVIDTIAFQTNLLALNAAVEAARAGEEGRGFAVVAGEVRSLAQRAAAAAREIRELVDASEQETDAGVQLVSQAGDAMRDVAAEVARISALMQDIAEENQEQSRRIATVNGAVEQMDDTTQRNAALVEQAAAAAASMHEQSDALLAAARRFTVAEAV